MLIHTGLFSPVLFFSSSKVTVFQISVLFLNILTQDESKPHLWSSSKNNINTHQEFQSFIRLNYSDAMGEGRHYNHNTSHYVLI